VNTKYLIAIAVTVVATIVFFVYKDKNNEKELKTHESQQYDRMIEVANKSSMAGMTQMGRALNSYREDKGVYPEKLSALYPEYIPVQAFLDEIEWYYEPGKTDFYLRKTYKDKNNRVLTASIGSDLKIQNGSMVASTSESRPMSTPAATKPVKKPDANVRLVSKAKIRPRMMTDITDGNLSRLQTADAKPDNSKKSPTHLKRSPYELKLVSTAQLSEEEQYVERVRGNMLVWKKDDGTIAFGNVQYPNSKKMIIYDNGKWIQIHQRSPNLKAKTEIPPVRAEKKAVVDRLAAVYSDRFLVWKDPEGTAHFSNVQYPDTQNIQIHVEGNWLSAKN
jgi:hypothetical protein